MCDFFAGKNVYAIGGYLVNHRAYPSCFMWDVVATNSFIEAEVIALEDSNRFFS